MKTRAPLTLGSAASPLARNQAAAVLRRLLEAHPRLSCEQVIVPIASGDTDAAGPFLAESRAAAMALHAKLLAGEFRLAAHYAADLALPLPDGLVRAAVLERETPFDAFLNRQGHITDEMPDGALIGVLNLRARAQMQALWPQLEVRVLRGGAERALESMMRHGLVDGLVLPAVVAEHLGIQALVSELYYPEMMLPGGGQGVVVVLAREDDEEAREAAHSLHSQATAWELDAEIAFVERIASDLDLAVGVLARVDGKRILVTGAIASPSGDSVNRASRDGLAAQAASVGAGLAEQLLLSGDSLLDLLEADFPDGLPTADSDEELADSDENGAVRGSRGAAARLADAGMPEEMELVPEEEDDDTQDDEEN